MDTSRRVPRPCSLGCLPVGGTTHHGAYAVVNHHNSAILLSHAARRAVVRLHWWVILALWCTVMQTALRHYLGVLVCWAAIRSFLVSRSCMCRTVTQSTAYRYLGTLVHRATVHSFLVFCLSCMWRTMASAAHTPGRGLSPWSA